MDSSHPDFTVLSSIRVALEGALKEQTPLATKLPDVMKDATDFVLDPIRTARTSIDELDNVEKTFIGLKVEHFFRDLIGVPKGKLRDLQIDDLEIDIKNTVGVTWMIPPETYRNAEPCILFVLARRTNTCSMGLILAKPEYLGGLNRDGKRAVTRFGRENIMWLVEQTPLPPSRWAEIDLPRFRELRERFKGTKRAAQFFRENLRKRIHRSVVQGLLFDQKDFMKRVRRNKGAPDLLRKEGIALISGDETMAILELGLDLDKDEFVSVTGLTAAERSTLKRLNLID